MKIRLLLFFWIAALPHLAFSQKVYNHGVFWGRLVLSDKISSKLKWELYLQKRTQNVAPGKVNIFAAPHYVSVWAWLNYSPSKNLKLSVSPFGYFDSHLFNITEADASQPGVKEFRYVARVETQQPFSFCNYFNRYSLEYRWRDLANDGRYQPNFRFRYMLRLEKPLLNILSKEKPLTLILSNEIMFQFGPAVANNPNVFDQNRFSFGASYEVFKNIKLTASYLNFFQERNSGAAFDYANALWVVLTFDNLFSQFSKQEVKPK